MIEHIDRLILFLQNSNAMVKIRFDSLTITNELTIVNNSFTITEYSFSREGLPIIASFGNLDNLDLKNILQKSYSIKLYSKVAGSYQEVDSIGVDKKMLVASYKFKYID